MSIVTSVQHAIETGDDSKWSFMVHHIGDYRSAFAGDSVKAMNPELSDKFMLMDCIEYGPRDALAMRGQ